MREKHHTIVIVGPTASGKSALAVKLAKKIGGEIVSADSRQVYKGLNIGTGKVTKREMRGVRHHLLDVASPKRVFTAHDFVSHARRAIDGILRRSNVPIVCGGTGFYIDALLGRIALSDAPPDPRLRARLSKKKSEQLFALLKKKDPDRAGRMNESDRKNPTRLIRAIEIASQKTPQNAEASPPHFEAFLAVEWIGIKPDMGELREKIRLRLLTRMRRGMVAEAKQLHAGGLSYKRMEALGLEYRYLARYLQGRIAKEEMLRQLEAQIWQYAKRQMTYWRRNTDIHWRPMSPSRFKATNASSKRSGNRRRTSRIGAL